MFLRLLRCIKTRHAPKGSFAAHVLTLMTGTTIAQAIPIAISPILTRLYTPSDFGVFALFSSLVSLAAIIATGRYELAIMLPEDDQDAINLMALSVGISLLVSSICLVVVAIFNSQIVALLNNENISTWLYWIPLSVLLTGIFQTLNYWTSRKKLYEKLSVSRVAQSASGSATNLVFGLSGLGASGLVFGNLIGQFAACNILAWNFWKKNKNKFNNLSKKNIKELAIKYQDLPRINSLHAFIDIMQSGGMVFIIAIFFGDVTLGFYALTIRILRAPLSLVGASVAQVFFQTSSEIYSQGHDLHEFTKKIMLRLSLIALPIFLIIYLIAPTMFSLVFGKEWEVSGQYAQIFSPLLALNFISSPLSQIVIIVGKQKEGLVFGIVYNIFTLAPLVLLAYLGKDIITSLWFSSMLSSIILAFYILWIIKISKASKKTTQICRGI